MKNQLSMRPGDVVVALQVAVTPGAPLIELAEASKRSIGEVHNSLGRLRTARLVAPEGRSVELEPLLQFIKWGVPVAYPAITGGTTIGIATAIIVGNPGFIEPTVCEFVWPFAHGTSRGESLTPLHPRVPEVAAGNPRLRILLSLVDLIRVGGVREQTAATAELERRLGGSADIE